MHFKTQVLPLLTAMTVGIAPSANAETTAPASSNTFMATLAAAETENTHLRKWTVPTAGMYTIRVPANSGIQLRINGNLLIDATGARLDDVGELITAFTTLEAGDHAIEVKGITAENLNIAMITVNAAGESPLPLIGLTTSIDESEANTILASRAGLAIPALGGTATAGLAPGAAPFTPFAIGGGSSNVARAAATAGAPGGGAGNIEMASATMPSAQGGAGMLGQAAMGGGSSGSATTSSGTSSGVTSSGGTSVPAIPASGGGSTPGTVPPGTVAPPATPVTPVVTPPDPVPPTPVVPEVPGTVITVSPLTPPVNPALPDMIQLTAAGNEDGMVTNTGTTLFGAVQADSVFDEIEVTFDPAIREAPTTVSVGATTGQFAVRMFEEDFATASQVRVTLVGKLSSNDEVTSQPVMYDITAVPTTNGISQALSRLTFGATPDLYARVRAIGFEAFVNEQLDPDSINDSVFENTDPEDLLNLTSNDTNTIFRSLMAHDTARAAFSQKQLQEVMARFWANHFHAITKGTEIKQQNIVDRQFYRENAFGNFEDMLLYSARSPLMSQYLDNDNNRIDGNRGLNQNYAREILELSTVGVNGGYGNDDIDAIARIFTGWAYTQTNDTSNNDEPREYAFEFFPERHDQGDKTIPFLATTIAGIAGPEGVQEGEQLVSILAQHSSTRTFVCEKIVQLLVADQPPANLTAACAAAWQASGGEVVPMLQAILLDPSYISTVDYQRNKVKNPFEFVVSTIRAFGAEPSSDNVDDFYRRFREVYEVAGYVPLFFGAPTGLPEVSGAWTSSAKLAASYEQMNFIAERRENYGIDLEEDVIAAGLETAEEVASYLMTVATADRFTKQEFDAVVEVLNGDDGFDLLDPDGDETRALEKAMGLIFVTPSFLLQ